MLLKGDHNWHSRHRHPLQTPQQKIRTQRIISGRNMYALSIISQDFDGAVAWNCLSWSTRSYLSCICNIISYHSYWWPRLRRVLSLETADTSTCRLNAWPLMTHDDRTIISHHVSCKCTINQYAQDVGSSISRLDLLNISCEIALRWMSQYLIDE